MMRRAAPWWPTSAARHLLAEGAERWSAFFAECKLMAGDRFALMEFVPGDSLAAFLRDAETLKSWLRT
jgi:hypothetical protein